ncbi:hypothetical protein TorRG33x02_186940 [Trema orientale]|uniref:Uncharacterized protein n=1 Tax=Trema orientale TaxID=63057 RepID=A0A2P5EJ50_TREOI|nr:hypothetical protein TorRG33x02_186940 [Trema orientale]
MNPELSVPQIFSNLNPQNYGAQNLNPENSGPSPQN